MHCVGETFYIGTAPQKFIFGEIRNIDIMNLEVSWGLQKLNHVCFAYIQIDPEYYPEDPGGIIFQVLKNDSPA